MLGPQDDSSPLVQHVALWETAREQGATIVGCLVGPPIAMLYGWPADDDGRDHKLRIASSGTAQIPPETVVEFQQRFGPAARRRFSCTASRTWGRHDRKRC
jgi:hypothetical protein